MSDSSLVNCKIMSPNHSGARNHKIDRITPHCVVGQLSAEGIGGCFVSESRKASCNYGIGHDGRVVLVVSEANRSWCSSNETNDQHAVTIECASGKAAPYAMNRDVHDKLVDLCVDICKRNGISKLLWLGGKEATLKYTPKKGEAVLTAHRWFANKECPGDWLYSRLDNLASDVTKELHSSKHKIISKIKTKLKLKPKAKIKVGSKVMVKPDAKTYDGSSVAAFVYGKEYRVDSIKGKRVLLDKNGICTPFNIKDLVLA